MSTQTQGKIDVDSPEQVSKRLDLDRRFLLAGLEDAAIFEGIPQDVRLFLLPDDDPSFAAAEIAAAARAAHRGADVYLRHVHVGDVPD